MSIVSPSGGGTTALSLAHELAEFAQQRLHALERTHFPGLALPSVFAGHVVGPDVRADLAFTLGLLHANGIGEVAGIPMTEAIASVLRPIDGPETHTFYSYRVAETVARFGPLADNPLLVGWSEAELDNLATACDSSAWVELLDRGMVPRNYAAVLARCEHDRLLLGLPGASESALADLLHRLTGLLGANPDGFLDDSHSGIGRYDIYTADIYLFTEPLAGRLGDVWRRGARQAVALVEKVTTADGTAVPWGRSTGALGACLTIELAGLALSQGLSDQPARWLALAANALGHMARWFGDDGVITAHQHRSTFSYRGPERRLQMTLDSLGKLAYAALELARVGDQASAGTVQRFPPRDELVLFDAERHAGAWTYRSADLAFVLPLVGSTVSDYLPSARNPGLFEVPVEAPLVTSAPLVVVDGHRYVAGHLPASVGHQPGRVVVEHDGFWPAGRFELPVEAESRRLSGRRRATYRVTRRTLSVSEELSFAEVPQSVSVAVAETQGRPLQVNFACDSPHTVSTIDTSGMKEWRSFWAELPKVHQIDIEPSSSVLLKWSVTPMLRVLSSAADHHYHRSLYDPLVASERVSDRQIPWSRLNAPAVLARLLEHWDQFHLHWPEWLLGDDLVRHQRFIGVLNESGVRIIWTQHNLAPHAGAAMDDIYQAWAGAAHGVIHHSLWGQEQVTARYRFRDDAEHRVIPHGHFPNTAPAARRADVETEHGLRPGATRLAIVGAPRAGKDVSLAMEAFARCGRTDLELWVLSLGPDDVAPEHPGIVARPYETVDRREYDRRLAAVDALLLPFDHRMLTTGTVGDAIGHGLPCIISDWPYLGEALGDAGVLYGSTLEDLTMCLSALDAEQLATAAAACRAKQAETAWSSVADRTFELLEEVGTSRL